MTKISLLKCFLSLCLLAIFSGCHKSRGLNPGELAPNFKLKNLKGEVVELDAYKARPIVLSFWASWCEPCIEELESLDRLHKSLRKRGGTVLSIGIDDTADNLVREVRNHGVTFPVLLDSSGTVKNRYKVTGVPETFLINDKSRITALAESNRILTRITGRKEWDNPNFQKTLFLSLFSVK